MELSDAQQYIGDKLREVIVNEEYPQQHLIIKLENITTYIMECLEIELQDKGYWVEQRRIGWSDDFIVKIEW